MEDGKVKIAFKKSQKVKRRDRKKDYQFFMSV